MKYFTTLSIIISVFFACDKTTDPTNGSANQRPIITSSATATAIRDSLFHYSIAVNEPDNQEVYVSLLESPAWLSISDDNISGITPWDADNTFFLVTASDGELSDTLIVLVTVEENSAFYIGLRPRDNYIENGSYISLILSINSVEDLFAISFDLVYDSAVAIVESAYIPSSSILEAANSIMFYDHIPNGVSISASRLQSNMNDNVTGSGPLIMIDFLCLADGSTLVEIQNVMIIDETGEINPDLGNLVLKAGNILVY